MKAIKTIQELLGKLNSAQSGKGYDALAEIEAEVKRLRMNKITDAKDLIVGEYYFWNGKPLDVRYTHTSGNFFVVGSHSERPHKDKPAYGPIPRPTEEA